MFFGFVWLGLVGCSVDERTYTGGGSVTVAITEPGSGTSSFDVLGLDDDAFRDARSDGRHPSDIDARFDAAIDDPSYSGAYLEQWPEDQGFAWLVVDDHAIDAFAPCGAPVTDAHLLVNWGSQGGVAELELELDGSVRTAEDWFGDESSDPAVAGELEVPVVVTCSDAVERPATMAIAWALDPAVTMHATERTAIDLPNH
jgi:hypothetical protein